MSATVALIVMIVGVVLAIVLGNKLKVNIGIICLAWAYFFGVLVVGNSVSSVVALFPVKILFLVFSVTYFFGFHLNNGTFEVLAKKLMYPVRNLPWALPLMLALVCAIVACIGGASATAVVIVGPIAYIIGIAAGFSPILIAIIVADGSAIMGMAPWTAIGGLFKGVCTELYGEELAGQIQLAVWGAVALGSVIMIVIAYFVFGGFKNKKVEMEKPAPFTPEQRKSLTLIIIFLVLVIVPMFGKLLFGGQFLTILASKLDVQMVALVLGVVCSMMKMGDEREVITKRVPWGMILMCCGLATFISVCSSVGAMEIIGGWINTGVSSTFLAPVICLIGAVLSFVSDTVMVGMNAFGGIFPVLAETSGISILGIIVAFQLGGAFSAISPFSMGGSLTLSMQPDEKVRTKQFTWQILVAIAQSILIVLLCMIGFWKIFS